MHPLWQPLQATKLPDGQYVINHNNAFGGAASGRCWWSVSSLMLWITEHKCGIKDLSNYIDDIFGWEYADNFLYYDKYKKMMPAKQVKLLQLWDKLLIPHDKDKQLYRAKLDIIGYVVNADDMLISMPIPAQTNLEVAITCFVTGKRPTHTLWQCQQLVGHINWALNVAPCLWPGLTLLYAKMYAPPNSTYNLDQVLHINEDILCKLHWFLNHFKNTQGLFLFHSIVWTPTKANATFYTDTSLSGVGMWSPKLQTGYYANIHTRKVNSKIFYYKAYIIVCAIHWASTQLPMPQRIVIFSDNTNTVNILNSMCAHREFNELLKFAIDILMTHDIDIWVIHIAGVNNIIADHLLQRKILSVHDIDNSLILLTYTPLLSLLGVGLR